MNKLIQPADRRIFRAEHGRGSPFVMTAMGAVNDKRLGLAALGLLVVLLSKPDSWDIDPDQIAREHGIGIHQARGLLKMLAQAGYLVAPVRTRNNQGQWAYSPYYLKELPGIAVTVLQNPSHGAPPADDGVTGENENQVQNPPQLESIANMDSISTEEQHQTDSADDGFETEPETGEIFADGEGPDPVTALSADGPGDKAEQPSPPVPAAPSPAVALLEKAGVDAPLRDVLGEKHGVEDVQKAIQYTDENADENPAGFLVRCLMFGWHKKPKVFIDRGVRYTYQPGQYDAYLNI